MKYICPNQIPKGRMGMREIINKIKKGYSIALMVDQRVSEGPKNHLFFNKPAHTTTVTCSISFEDMIVSWYPFHLERKEDVNFEMTIFMNHTK